ncbi:MAG: hypothetical protein ABIR24_03260 [Verrucomicrobiota bacterium]
MTFAGTPASPLPDTIGWKPALTRDVPSRLQTGAPTVRVNVPSLLEFKL